MESEYASTQNTATKINCTIDKLQAHLDAMYDAISAAKSQNWGGFVRRKTQKKWKI